MADRPTVSVLLVTFNHIEYIDRALASIAMQRIDADVEVVVADDHSTDGTRERIEEWAARQTHLTVRVLPEQARLGITQNYHRGFSACQGEYVACLEGDDEWIRDDRLAIGARLLDEHPDHTMVASRVLLFDDDSGSSSVIPLIGMDRLVTELTDYQIAENNWFATFSACMYRADVLERIGPEVFETTSYDWMICMSVTAHGPALLAPEVATLYRVHEGGQWSSAKQRDRDELIRGLLPRYIELLDGEQPRRELTRLLHDLESRLSATPDLPEAESAMRDAPIATPVPTGVGERPRVSVVMTCYDHEAWVREAIDSVLDQTMGDLELVVVDDRSNDGSVGVIAEFDDPRVRVFRFAQNQGAAAALNFAIQQTRGELVAVLNSDDVWERRKLERQMAVLDARPELGAVFTGARYVDEHGAPLPAERIPSWSAIFRQPNRSQAQWLRFFFEHGNALCHPSILIRRRFYEEHGLYDNRLRQLPDFERWITLVKHYPIHVLGDEDLVRFRLLPAEQNASASSRPNRIRGLAEHEWILRGFFVGASNRLIEEAFRDVLRLQTIEREDERLCAIAFLLWDAPCPLQELNRELSTQMLRELLGRTDTALLLRTRFQFDELALHRQAAHDSPLVSEVAAEWLARADHLTYLPPAVTPVEHVPAGELARIVVGRARRARLGVLPHRLVHHLGRALGRNP
ncbi:MULTISPECIES: glycosyltransferase family 2 protein [unclassified Agrococcus]|uniref:glycosyltransferase family 2 protein n=1 Tax=unclassified Agrococcus TaxID=2615065 RepID=UPI00360EAAB3